jgi:uncharacterized protein (TIGR02246 family)
VKPAPWRIIALLGPLCCWPALGSAQPAAQNESEVERVVKAYVDALKSNDAQRAVAFYQDECIYAGPGTPTMRSRDAIRAFVAAAYKAAKVDYEVVFDDVDAGTDTASVIGTYSATIRAAGQTPSTRGGRFLFVLNRQSDGGWKISRAFSTDLPDKGN